MSDSNPFAAVTKFFDPYSRVARLYPSLIAIGPILWSTVAIFPTLIQSGSQSAAFVIAATCVFYFLTSVARSLGKRVEPRLIKDWGGWPTTTLLRHRDETIDQFTKERYHQELARLSGLTLPSKEEEARDPARADDLYRSATKKLIESRRGAQHTMLHSENASYGFRRNLLGLKPVILVETFIVFAITVFGWWVVTPQPYSRDLFATSVVRYPHFPILLGLDLGYFLLCAWAVTPSFVHQAGKEYSEALLRTLDA